MSERLVRICKLMAGESHALPAASTGKAKEFFQKALAYMPSGTPVSIAQSELYLSRIYLEQGQTDSAFHYINNAICQNLPRKETAALHLQKGYILPFFCKLTRPRITSCLFT